MDCGAVSYQHCSEMRTEARHNTNKAKRTVNTHTHIGMCFNIVFICISAHPAFVICFFYSMMLKANRKLLRSSAHWKVDISCVPVLLKRNDQSAGETHKQGGVCKIAIMRLFFYVNKYIGLFQAPSAR